jgi:hypothetical protein
MLQNKLNIDEDHVIVDKKDWEKIREEMTDLSLCPTCNCMTKKVCGKCAAEDKRKAVEEYSRRVVDNWKKQAQRDRTRQDNY